MFFKIVFITFKTIPIKKSEKKYKFFLIKTTYILEKLSIIILLGSCLILNNLKQILYLLMS